MKVAHIDCFSGISGNMLLGALLDLGADARRIRDELKRLSLGSYEITVETVRRGSLAATHFSVTEPPHGPEGHGPGHPHHHRSYRDIVEIISTSSLSDRVRSISLDAFERVARAEARIHGVKIDDVAFHEIGAVDSIVDIVGGAAAVEQLGIARFTATRVPLGHGTVKT
ncbi:MAG: nickel insertion protein, partial [Vicinamibacteria bacterium]